MSYSFGRYEPRVIQAVCRTLRPGDTAIDVGAHFGYHTLCMSRCVGWQGRVLAFEPNPYTFPALEKTIKLNRLSNVTPYPYALSQTAGKRAFKSFTLPGDGVASFDDPELFGHQLERNSVPDLEEKKYEVDCVVLDEFLEPGVSAGIKLIKIDVEGAELLVLQGMKKIIEMHHPCLILELTGAEELAAAQTFLEDFGYRMEMLETWNVKQRGGARAQAANVLFEPRQSRRSHPHG